MSPSSRDPVVDPERVARVVGTGLLDTPPEPALDRLTHVACRALEAPIGYASLITDDRQFLMSTGGREDPCAPARDLALTHTYCPEVVRSGRPLVVADARASATWRRHPVVTELGLVAYLGVPLKANGHVLGTLCVLDRVGRDWRPDHVALLEELAAAVSHELDNRVERERRSLRERRLTEFAQRVIEGPPRLEELLLEAVGGVASGLQLDACAVVQRAQGGELIVTAALGQGVTSGALRVSDALRSALTRALGQPRRKPFGVTAPGGGLVLRGAEDDPAAFDAAVLAPVSAGAPWGVMLGLARGGRAFTAADLEVLGAFARLLGGAARRTRADHDLVASERRTRSLLDSASEGVCGLDRAGRLTSCNTAAARLLGYGDANELLGRPLEAFLAGAAAEGVAWVRAALAEGRPSHVKREVLQRADGATFVAECRALPLRVDRRVEGAVVTFSDVTARTQTEAERSAAQRASAELTALLAAAPIGIGLVDAELRYRRLNHALAQLNGVPAEEHIGRRVREMIPGPAGERIEELLRRVIATGEPIHGVEVAHHCPEDPHQERVVLGSAYPVTFEGRVQGIGVACFEVTELKRHEEEQRLLSEASSLLASLGFDTNLREVAALFVPRLAERCAVYLTDRAGATRLAADPTQGPARPDPTRDSLLLALASEALRMRKALVSPPIVGQEAGPGQATDPQVTVLERAQAQALSRAGISAVMLVPVVGGGDHAAGVLALWSAAKDRHNTSVALRLAREVARRVAQASESARLLREAQEATRSREQVLAVVSHDLRTPLTTILMAAARLSDLLERSPGVTPAQSRPLVLIQRSARTMKRLIDDLLDFAAIETGRLRIDTKPEAAARVIHEVVSSFQQQADANRVVLLADAAPGLPPIQADRERVEQVLSNILGNALKVTPPNGTIAVRARRAGQFVQFSVTDTGPGLPRDQLQVVFERYWRGDGGGAQGVGLGLAIAKGIVEAHGGAIHAESEPGAGATFRFTVPVASRW